MALKANQVQLERAFSKLGFASRTEARAWIIAGRVRVNGTTRRSPTFGLSLEGAVIELDGKRITRVQTRTFLLHKPRGLVTTRVDDKGRQTVFSLVSELDLHLVAVGRLDWATSGLLILTNDTELSGWLTDPENGVRRTYLVSVRGEITEKDLFRLREGIDDEGEKLRADEIVVRKASGRESHLTVHLSEGKNREIRRMFLSLNHEVTKLKRVAYGGLDLGELPVGKHIELSYDDLACAFPGAPIRQS